MQTFKKILYVIYTVLAALVAAGIISACTSCYNYSVTTAVSYVRCDSCTTVLHDNIIYHVVDSANFFVDSLYRK